MIEYDFTRYMGSVAIASNAKSGLWASQTNTKSFRSTRTAGYIPKPVTNHELLACALNSGLRSITNMQLKRIINVTKVERPAMLVASMDKSFIMAMSLMAANPDAPVPLAFDNRRLLHELQRQLRRFAVTFEYHFDHPSIVDIRDYANRNVYGGRLVPDLLRPSLVSTTT